MSDAIPEFNQNLRAAVHSMIPYTPGRSLESVKQSLGITNVIKLASNENPLGPAVHLSQLTDTNITHYPDTDHSGLLDQLSALWRCGKENLIVGNGSDEIMQLLALTFLNPGDDVITASHTFSEYQFVAHLMAAVPRLIPLTSYHYDLTAMQSAVSNKTKLIFIANPNNPTGTIVSHEQLDSFLMAMPKDVVVVLDEAYAEYSVSASFPDTQLLLKKHPNLIVLRTFSKLYGLAGLRIGYGVGDARLIASLKRVKQPFNVNQLALKSAEEALKNTSHVQDSLDLNNAGKAYFYSELNRLDVVYIPTEANFIFIQLEKNADIVSQALLEKGIIVRSLDSFGFDKAIRVTIGTEVENKQFISCFEAVLRA